MKYIYLLPLFFSLVSCGQVNNDNNSSGSDSSAETLIVPDSNSISGTDLHVDSIEIIELKEKNQINDYAEYFLQAKVFEDREKMNYENGDMHYYETLDLKNGYASVTGAYEGSYQFAIWRMANGNDLVGKTSMGCGPVCDYEFSIYEITKEGDIDVTQTIIPMDEIEKQVKKMVAKAKTEGKMDETVGSQLKFILPQKGTSMEVYLSMNSNELEFPLVTLSWDKSTFTIGKIFEEIPD